MIKKNLKYIGGPICKHNVTTSHLWVGCVVQWYNVGLRSLTGELSKFLSAALDLQLTGDRALMRVNRLL